MYNKEFIEIDNKEITKDCVYFTSSSTTYANERRVPSHSIKDLLKRCAAVCKQLKASGCKVSHKYRTRKEIADSADQYAKELLDYNHNFDLLVSYATWITSKPLPVGTSDNEEMNTMYLHRNNCMKSLYRNTVLSKVLEFAHKLDTLEQELEDGDCNYSHVYF